MESVSSDYSAYNSFLSHINQLSKVLHQPLAFPLATQRDWRTADCPSCDLSKYSWIKVPAHSLIPKYISGANKRWNKASHLTAAVNCIPLQSVEIDASVQSSMWQPTTFFRLPGSLSSLRRVWKPRTKAKEGKRRPDTTHAEMRMQNEAGAERGPERANRRAFQTEDTTEFCQKIRWASDQIFLPTVHLWQQLSRVNTRVLPPPCPTPSSRDHSHNLPRCFSSSSGGHTTRADGIGA